MARAELGLLPRELQIRPSRQRGLHGVGLVADDDHDRGGGKGIGGAKDVLDQRQAAAACRTLGRRDFIRVPLPAARTTRWSGFTVVSGPGRGLVPRARR